EGDVTGSGILLLSVCSRRAAEKMHFPAATPFVKMRLERPAGHSKRENKIIFPLNMPRVKRRAF
ncbi:hypothetical protein, partial [Faecalibacterium sp.]|uniref:hypothetical protein n=1 Tax=Faecalibacterium sp. TaxID=1971605 RepID=UPI0025BA396D